jgi:hypothetical protein
VAARRRRRADELVRIQQQDEVGEEGGFADMEHARHALALGVGEFVVVRDDDGAELPRAQHRDPARGVHRRVVQDHHAIHEARIMPDERLDNVLLVLHHRQADNARPRHGNTNLKNQKFFGSFFQKRTAFLF